MPEYLASGVFIEEIGAGPKPIEGVPTGTAAFLGETERGPMQPRLLTGYDQYLRLYGDVFTDGKYMPLGVKAFFDNGGRRCHIARIVGEGAAAAALDVEGCRIEAIGPGRWGNRVFVRITQAGDGSGATGFRLQVAYYRDEATAAPSDPFDEPNPDRASPEPELTEDFDDLSLDPDSEHDWRKRVADSALITLEIPDGTTAWPPRGDDVLGGWLNGGVDGSVPGVLQFEGQVDDSGHAIEDPEQRRGLAALDLDRYFDVAIVHAPGIGNVDDETTAIQRAIVTHCERNGFRFAVLDAAPGLSVDSDHRLDPRATLETRYAAFYYPWYYTPHPRDGVKTLVPPGAAVCGSYARTDSARGVWKPPANVVVAGAVDLEYDVDRDRQAVLNPRGVNCIRRLRGRGIRVWGARTLSTDPEWKYISVRRLVIFLEHSIYRSTQWVVFEPNGPRLWARVKQTITAFLSTQWRLGALSGSKQEEAFSVSVGPETMTEDDILNGRLVVEIGIAPVRPAEFVIFRIFQKTVEADPGG